MLCTACMNLGGKRGLTCGLYLEKVAVALNRQNIVGCRNGSCLIVLQAVYEHNMLTCLMMLLSLCFVQVPMKKENGQTVMVPLFQSQENIAGKVHYLIVV